MNPARFTRSMFVACAILSGSPGWSSDGAGAGTSAAAPLREPVSMLVADGRDARASEDGTAVQVAAAASAGAPRSPVPMSVSSARQGPEPPFLLLLVAALLVVIFVSTRRQRDQDR